MNFERGMRLTVSRTRLLNPEQFRVAATISTLPDSYLVKNIKMATKEDTWATDIKKELQEQPRNPNRDDLDQFE
jgi:hypothetical protein